ncbi:hypothetical protein AAGS61_09930 [Lysinibacillus sp. KU-BSD001]|uniref:hypothetical protein n=1 Tax=Lysinibacillus sp. KU-BSD001 TaxID=3141328 RepID=UPI0036EFB222
MTLIKITTAFFYSLAIVVLSVLFIGLVLSAVLSILAGILRTFGFEQIKMSIGYGIDLPIALSIPLSLLAAFLLFFCSFYIKRLIKFILLKLRF